MRGESMQCHQFVIDDFQSTRRQCRRKALPDDTLCKRHRNKQQRLQLNAGELRLLNSGERIINRKVRRNW